MKGHTMFITLTFVNRSTGEPTYTDTTVNTASIRSFKAIGYHDGERGVDGTKIVWTEGSRAALIVTAKPEQIAKALGAKNLTS